MEKKTFEAASIFEWNHCVDYSSDGIVSKRVIDRPTGNVSLFAFDEGQRLSEHSAPFDALVQVTEGEAQIIIGGVPYILQQGQCIIMPANIPHAVNALSRFKMVLTMIKG
ncbi:MAG: cupin domain-containing protein [Bacteroidales bacterium]|jgi:quercetin dioxygenase-like cupin family protein|nr:cupin domain-containing protein [Bacteroidales bacterium]NPV37376.1 cupin domain-containing protein [Bacteroidales bacterium]